MIYHFIYIKCFFFEHVLMRIEKSKYKDNIILKGGVLLSSILGCDMRTTKDIDATLKGLPLNENSIKKYLKIFYLLISTMDANFK